MGLVFAAFWTAGVNPAARYLAKKRNDARTELTTSRRRSLASSSRNDDTESMTHPTDGTCGIMHRTTGKLLTGHEGRDDRINGLERYSPVVTA